MLLCPWNMHMEGQNTRFAPNAMNFQVTEPTTGLREKQRQKTSGDCIQVSFDTCRGSVDNPDRIGF